MEEEIIIEPGVHGEELGEELVEIPMEDLISPEEPAGEAVEELVEPVADEPVVEEQPEPLGVSVVEEVQSESGLV